MKIYENLKLKKEEVVFYIFVFKIMIFYKHIWVFTSFVEISWDSKIFQSCANWKKNYSVSETHYKFVEIISTTKIIPLCIYVSQTNFRARNRLFPEKQAVRKKPAALPVP